MKKEKIVICSSMSFGDEINQWRENLEKNNYTVIKYPEQFAGEFLSNYKIEFSDHYQKIAETDIEMVTKLFLLQFAIFRQYFVKLAQNDFHRSVATLQSFCWLSSSWRKISKFRYEIVL